MTELREMVRAAVGRTLDEAKKKGRTPKGIPTVSDEAVESQRERQVRGTGYTHSPQNDFSQPLGDANHYKSQGAANFGNYTGVGGSPFLTAEGVLRQMREMQLRRVIRAVVAEEVKARRGR